MNITQNYINGQPVIFCVHFEWLNWSIVIVRSYQSFIFCYCCLCIVSYIIPMHTFSQSYTKNIIVWPVGVYFIFIKSYIHYAYKWMSNSSLRSVCSLSLSDIPYFSQRNKSNTCMYNMSRARIDVDQLKYQNRKRSNKLKELKVNRRKRQKTEQT